MVGFNFRMGEIEAAIGLSQLRKLARLVAAKSRAGELLTEELRSLEGLRLPAVKPDCTHVFYAYSLVIDPQIVEVERPRLLDALRAEGVPGLAGGYVNVHRLPMYQKRIAFGSGGFPWTGGAYRGSVSYDKGICPTAERLHDETFIGLPLCLYEYSDREIDLVARAFRKVWAQRSHLRTPRAESAIGVR